MNLAAINGEEARGIALWFTGLSGSGKTTLCRGLAPELRKLGHRVWVLDADELRRTVNRDLGFSKVDRDLNVARIASIARILVQQGWIVLVAAISPYRDARSNARRCIGNFLEIYVDAPVQLCMQRDPKGHYAKALQGQLRHFTGVDDPYEPPQLPDLHLDTAGHSVTECTAMILAAVREFLHDTEKRRYDFATPGAVWKRETRFDS